MADFWGGELPKRIVVKFSSITYSGPIPVGEKDSLWFNLCILIWLS